MVKILLQHKAKMDVQDEGKDNIEERDLEIGNKAIHHAVLGNHPEVLQLLLDHGASPNEMNYYYRTPLHLAAMKGHAECLRLLLTDERCDSNLEDYKEKRAFELVVESSLQSVEMFNLFQAFDKKLADNHFNGDDIFLLAIKTNNFKAAAFLLRRPEGKKWAQEYCDDDDLTPLYSACYVGHNQIAKLLVSHVDKDENGKPWEIDTPDKNGMTPLMRAIETCNHELIEFLIEAGANLRATDKKGATPFHYAASFFREKEKSMLGPSTSRFIVWPNEETAPGIFKVYNELKTKRLDDNLCPISAIVVYLVSKGGIPKNLTVSDIKNLIGDDFLYGEIEKINSDASLISQHIKEIPFDNQDNSNFQNQRHLSSDKNNGYSPLHNLALLSDTAHVNQSNQFISTVTTQQSIGLLNHLQLPEAIMEQDQIEENGTAATKTFHQETPSQTEMSIRDYNNLNTQQQPTLPFQQQQSGMPDSTPYYGTTYDTDINATISVPLTAPSDNNVAETADEPQMSEIRSLPHATTAADNSVNSRPSKEVTLVTCSIEKRTRISRKGGSTEDKISWILIDDQNRRYSQQKSTVDDIYQCTANVTSNDGKHTKKCKGTIYVQDREKLNVLKDSLIKTFAFTVRNAHEEHLPGKRGRPSTDTESVTSSTSGKRKKT